MSSGKKSQNLNHTQFRNLSTFKAIYIFQIHVHNSNDLCVGVMKLLEPRFLYMFVFNIEIVYTGYRMFRYNSVVMNVQCQ